MRLFKPLAFILSALISTAAFPSITVSGISSGAYMAQQFHTAFSSEVSGVGIIAGGPYFCAKGKMIDALNRCMKTALGMPRAQDSIMVADNEARGGKIDPIHHIASSKVYILSGTSDNTVVPRIAQVVIDNYKGWKVPLENIKTELSMNVGHAFPTDHFGNKCPTPSTSPFISNCNRDIAGEMLSHLLGSLEKKVQAKPDRLFSFNQLDGLGIEEMDRLSMNKLGYVYIPEGCESPEKSACNVHIAFHGCKQTVDDIQNTFMMKTGYNEWAEANRIVILYPQAQKNMLLNNPNGCWDWWGYTGPNYHTKFGPQMEKVHSLLGRLREGKLSLAPATF